MSELKPCPCCNGKADIVMMDEYYDGNTWVYHYSIECKTCGLVTRSDTDRVIAGELWNRRASPWIRFEDRKPEEGQVCVFYWIDSDDLETWKYRKSGMSQNRPSHWMPVPEVEEV